MRLGTEAAQAERCRGNRVRQENHGVEVVLLRNDEWVRILQELRKEPVPIQLHNVETMRRFIEAVLWVAERGAFWHQTPEEFGSWRAIYVRFIRWEQAGAWVRVLDALDESLVVRHRLEELVRTCGARRRQREKWGWSRG